LTELQKGLSLFVQHLPADCCLREIEERKEKRGKKEEREEEKKEKKKRGKFLKSENFWGEK
jgi:predicted transposase YdaD